MNMFRFKSDDEDVRYCSCGSIAVCVDAVECRYVCMCNGKELMYVYGIYLGIPEYKNTKGSIPIRIVYEHVYAEGEEGEPYDDITGLSCGGS